MTPIVLLYLLGVPAGVAAVLLGVAGVLSRHAGPGPAADAPSRGAVWSRVVAPVAVAAGAWSADFAIHQWHPVWDRDGTMRYLAVALAAGAAGVVHAGVGRWAVTGVLRAILGAGVAAAVLLPLAGGRYVPWGVFWGLVPAGALWLAVAGGVLDRADRSLPRLSVPAGMAVAAAGIAPGLFASTYAGGAQLAGAMAAIAGGASVARLAARRGAVELSGGWTVWLAVLEAVLLVTFAYTDVPALWVLPVMALAPLGVAAGLAARGRAARFVAAVVGAVVLSGGASVAAWAAAGHDGGGSSEDGGSSYGY